MNDACYCYCCHHFAPSSTTDKAFTVTGFSNWKKTRGHKEKSNSLLKHKLSSAHRSSFVAWEEYRQSAQKGHTIQDIVSQSTLQVSEKEIEDNRYLLKTVIDILLLCAKQGIALRGHDETED